MTTPKTGFHTLTDAGFNPYTQKEEIVTVRIRVWRKRDGWAWDYWAEGFNTPDNGLDGWDGCRFAAREEALAEATRLQAEHIAKLNNDRLATFNKRNPASLQ
jgi:hypothetical protein